MTTEPNYTDSQIEHIMACAPPIAAACLSQLLSERQAAMQRQGGGEVVELSAWVGDMKTSAGMDYYVCVGTAHEYGKYMTPNYYKIRGRAEYDVAYWNHMLGRGDKPSLLDFAVDAPPQPVRSVSDDGCPACHKNWDEHRSGYSASRCTMKKQQPPVKIVSDEDVERAVSTIFPMMSAHPSDFPRVRAALEHFAASPTPPKEN